jgi:hypothetical protein
MKIQICVHKLANFLSNAKCVSVEWSRHVGSDFRRHVFQIITRSITILTLISHFGLRPFRCSELTSSCNETNPMHYLSSIYSVTTLVHVSGLLVAHHQEVTMYLCDNWYLFYVLVDCRRSADVQHVPTVAYIAAYWWWATSKPETCTGVVTQ